MQYSEKNGTLIELVIFETNNNLYRQGYKSQIFLKRSHVIMYTSQLFSCDVNVVHFVKNTELHFAYLKSYATLRNKDFKCSVSFSRDSRQH